ncbi:hypothetical protein GLYMA_17G122900v4 [Glycine max]|uniref:Uncharacterized protein n=2 Tax=Glycine subgen. Soja TaxID=1462606 RepID=K7MLB6_SOYBN|nr:hypothetical protein JHK84_047211 [Glycine max]KAH1118137.1 hypothetical protein GYH30_047060 [Glycine max]KHN10430.1 hypothetical protein glysoja_030866 [Glycine soja]KRH03834.1 hypothetical protein GLYMA_17G122900v4 [Glycine max]RZB56560.1 hypothetical protein D0Y65_045621 [Glycine soja]
MPNAESKTHLYWGSILTYIILLNINNRALRQRKSCKLLIKDSINNRLLQG